ncbi:hypothetical protein B296_00024078 [Ensete ventricosum]|uniref:Uncharacterized protein n=1 Tax=Ensete ventricosum TaxID=4639 RepID=A0A427ATW4_ENSVE|nr:hypothetical protein B296_00024078 [Ensete ventricosum]
MHQISSRQVRVRKKQNKKPNQESKKESGGKITHIPRKKPIRVGPRRHFLGAEKDDCGCGSTRGLREEDSILGFLIGVGGDKEEEEEPRVRRRKEVGSGK